MDAAHFDRLVLTLTRARTRRSVLGLLGGLGVTGLLARDAVGQMCLANGQRCGGGRGTCCSGRCVRKRGTNRKFCRKAPDQSICTIESNVCAISSPPCNATGGVACACFVTTRGFSVCADISGNPACLNCTSDADCVNRDPGGQAGDRCVQCSGACPETNNRACIRKCPDPA
jgi:hypothetical protein